MLIPSIDQLNPGLNQRRSLLVSYLKVVNHGKMVVQINVKKASFGWYIPISSMVSGWKILHKPWFNQGFSVDLLTKMSAWNSPSRSVAASSARKDTKFLRR